MELVLVALIPSVEYPSDQAMCVHRVKQSVRVLCIEGTVSINCKGGFHPSIGDSSLLCYKHHVR